MKVYALGQKARISPSFLMVIAPAGDVQNQEVPSHWVDENNKPVQFNINFEFGAAEVDDTIGRYLIEKGLAKRTSLILPRQDGEQIPLDLGG